VRLLRGVLLLLVRLLRLLRGVAPLFLIESKNPMFVCSSETGRLSNRHARSPTPRKPQDPRGHRLGNAPRCRSGQRLAGTSRET